MGKRDGAGLKKTIILMIIALLFVIAVGADTTCTTLTTQTQNNNANLDMQTSNPVANDVANIEFLEQTCTTGNETGCNYPGTTETYYRCGCNYTQNLNMGGNLMIINGTGTLNIIGNITNVKMKINQSQSCNIIMMGGKIT